MKVFQYEDGINKDKYQKIQIQRSKTKFSFCRVSILDALVSFNVIKNNAYNDGPIICMGTRNGREVDLFRIASSSRMKKKLSYLFEIEKRGRSPLFKWFERNDMCDISNIQNRGVYGCELNPEGKRKDIHIGSFDDLPAEYENKFEVVYSNSFDQALDPHQTAKEWMRIVKNDGYIIFHFVEDDTPNYTDPTGNMSFEDVIELFPGTVIHRSTNGNFDGPVPSSAIIIKIKK